MAESKGESECAKYVIARDVIVSTLKNFVHFSRNARSYCKHNTDIGEFSYHIANVEQ